MALVPAPRALVLAGRRGPSDRVALALGATHRAIVPICGVPMLQRVVETLVAAGVSEVSVSIDEPRIVEELPGLQALIGGGRLRARPSAESPAASVLEFLRNGAASPAPVLATTADHPLLTPAMVEAFWSQARDTGADLACGVVTEQTFRARYPDQRRTFVRLSDDCFSGANLFALLTPAAAAIADFWRRAERHRKQPWRLAGALGLGALLRFAAGRLSVGEALDCVARATGARAALVKLPFAEAAMDVDRPEDFALAARLLERARTDG